MNTLDQRIALIDATKPRPGKMDPAEQIRRHRLQLEGLASWPDDEIKASMVAWVNRRICALMKN